MKTTADLIQKLIDMDLQVTIFPNADGTVVYCRIGAAPATTGRTVLEAVQNAIQEMEAEA